MNASGLMRFTDRFTNRVTRPRIVARCGRALRMVMLNAVLGAILSGSMSASVLAQGEDDRRALIRERQIERIQGRQERRERIEQRQMERQPALRPDPSQSSQAWQPPEGFDNRGFDKPGNLNNRPAPGRLTPEQRQALRRQIQEAGRNYPQPRP